MLNLLKHVWARTFEPMLIRALAKKLTHRLHSGIANQYSNPSNQISNLCGSGGQTDRPVTKRWIEIFSEYHGHKNVNLNRADIESLFFAYFGPLEAWCEKNLHSDFLLWSDINAVHLFLIHEYDKTLFALRWGDTLPHAKDIDQI